MEIAWQMLRNPDFHGYEEGVAQALAMNKRPEILATLSTTDTLATQMSNESFDDSQINNHYYKDTG